MRVTSRLTLAVALLVAWGCAPSGEAEEAEAEAEAPGASWPGEPTPVPDRPAGMMDSLTVDGTRVPARLTLLASPGSFPAPFSTYVPSDLDAEFVRLRGAPALRLTAALGGIAVETASLEVVFPDGAGGGSTRPVLDSLEAEGWRSEEAEAGSVEPWARHAWRLRRPMPGGDRHEGWLALGERDGHPFYVLVRHPSGLAVGLAPRIEAVLDRWRWEGDKTPLRSGGAGSPPLDTAGGSSVVGRLDGAAAGAPGSPSPQPAARSSTARSISPSWL